MNQISKNFKALPKVLVFLGCLGIVLTLISVPGVDSRPPAAGTLFGIAFIDGANRLVSIDPETGELTIVGSFPGFFWMPQGISALDPVNHRYFFLLAERLFSVDTQTGAVIANPPFHASIGSLEFEPTTNTLYAIAFVSGVNTLVIVDPSTGAITPVGSFPGSPGAPQGISALDPVNHIYFYPEDGRLVSVDTQTGAVIAYPLLSVSPTSLEFELFMVQEVAIDIKPGSFPNSINPKSRGRIPVAILTTDTFDATTVDPTTVRFGPTGTEAAPVQSAFEDVNGDLETDMIFHFQTQVTGIACGDTKASLTGETFDRQMIQGADSIKTVGCK